MLSRTLNIIRKAAIQLLMLPIRFYRYFISPWRPPACRFTPTCSAYAQEALQVHGPAHGSYLALKRICRCHPFANGGVDPVPPANTQCTRPTTGADRSAASASKANAGAPKPSCVFASLDSRHD